MSLPPGARLGPYEILSALGAGGMGEVYKARDTRLGREVAIKVLSESFARDPERMRRFEQEARAVAALSHPNVLAIFDTGTHEGSPYLVSELLEGESLRRRLEEGPLPMRKAVEYAQQVADGLAAAHEKGVVHRDLKPENLFLTSAGRVKILDFGLAKLQPPPAAEGAPDAATASLLSPTMPGLVMGTAGYMAPEQVRGEAVDSRADIFSFGATLYEMLSGRRAFRRDTAIETMTAILKDDPPDLGPDQAQVAPGLERIVLHCLEKKPADRFQSARDLTFALAALAGTVTGSAPHVAVPSRRRWIRAALAAAALALLALAIYLLRYSTSAAERADFAIPVPGEVSHVALSPDGRWLAFVSPGDQGSDPVVYVQRIGGADARALPGTGGASYPFWSPDDAWVAFFAGGKLKKVALAGGEPQSLANLAGTPRGGSWGSRGVIIYAPDTGGPLWRINADGSGAAPLTDKLLAPYESSHRWPVFLPDGDRFLLFAGNFNQLVNDPATGLYLSSLSRHEKVQVLRSHSSGGFADGRLYWVDADGALVSVALDVRSGKTAGEPRVVAARAALSPSTFYATFAVARNGTVVYSAASNANHSQLTWFDAAGKELGRVGGVGVLANPALSPDGARVAYDSNDFRAQNVDVWIAGVDRGTTSRFTFTPREEVTPVWSRDGSTIAYAGDRDVLLKKASGLEPEKPAASTASPADDLLPSSWSPDGKQILCTYQSPKQGFHLVLVPAAGGKVQPFLSGAGNQINGQISPDGKWAAYASSETGDWEIYVTTFPDAAGKWQVSRGGGTEPRWRGDGQEIFYIGPRRMLTAVPVSSEGAFSAGAPRPLFEIHARAPISSTDMFTYDVTRDGRRFLVNQYVRPEQIPPLSIVLHADAPAAK